MKRLPGEAYVSLPLQATGGEGERWWFINGEPLDNHGRALSLRLEKRGEYQLVVMDGVGQTATVLFRVL